MKKEIIKTDRELIQEINELMLQELNDKVKYTKEKQKRLKVLVERGRKELAVFGFQIKIPNIRGIKESITTYKAKKVKKK